MSPELEQKLYNKFPKLFAQKDLPKTQTCMCWGIDVRDEWFHVIESVCETIQDYINFYKRPQIEFNQIKEKFGTLCMYYNDKDPYIDGVIAVAERIVKDNAKLLVS